MSKAIKSFLSLLLMCSACAVNADLIDGEELQDPTRPIFAGNNNGEGTSEVLNMIRNVLPASFDLSFIRAGSSPIAVINQERVTIGDVVGGATVIGIERSSVTLSINGEERNISLYGNGIKTPVSQ